jgi:two-component system nitrate/nitrite response regulator NarL
MTQSAPQTVLVIDDHPLLRKGVGQLLAMDDSLVLAGEADSGERGLALARRLHPDLILLDLHMKGMGGLETLEALRAMELDSRVIILTVSDDEMDVVAALRLGAEGYLLKDMEPEDLLDGLRRAAAGRLALGSGVADLLARALREEARPRSPEEAGLTERERQVLALLPHGGSNKVIARELGISEGTVKVHIKNLLKKLHLKSRTEAAVWAVEHELSGKGGR